MKYQTTPETRVVRQGFSGLGSDAALFQGAMVQFAVRLTCSYRSVEQSADPCLMKEDL